MSKKNLKSNQSYLDKWPPEIAKNGFTQIPNCIVKCRANLGLNTSESITLIHLCSYDYGSKTVWPSHRRLATESGLGNSTIRSILVSLEAKGYIRRVYRTGLSNKYDLLPSVNKLREHRCINPAKKLAHPHQESGRPPPYHLSTKKDYSRRINKNTESIKVILDKRMINAQTKE